MRAQIEARLVRPYKHRVVDGRVVLDVIKCRAFRSSIIISCSSNVVLARRPNDKLTVEVIDGGPDEGSAMQLADSADLGDTTAYSPWTGGHSTGVATASSSPACHLLDPMGSV